MKKFILVILIILVSVAISRYYYKSERIRENKRLIKEATQTKELRNANIDINYVPLKFKTKVLGKNQQRVSFEHSQGLNVYLGQLHAHSTFSLEGKGTPEQNYDKARKSKDLDFFALTEHEYVWLDNGKYEKLKQISASFQSDNFLPILGFEYSNLIAGHYVVLNTNTFKSSWGDLSPDDLYSWLKKPEQKDALVIFAHPGFHSYRKPFEFSHFKFDKDIVDKIIGIETHHWDPITFLGPGYGGKLLFIDEAVQSGWWLAPISSNDSHDYRNVPGKSRIGVVAEELSQKAIFSALKKRMTFASSFPIQLFASALVGDQQYPMGSHIPTSETLKIICDFVIPEEEKVGLERIEVLINGKVKAIKKLRDVSNADLTAVPQSTASGARPESGRIVIDINKPNIPSSPGYIYLRIFGYKAGKLIPSPIYVAPFYLK